MILAIIQCHWTYLKHEIQIVTFRSRFAMNELFMLDYFMSSSKCNWSQTQIGLIANNAHGKLLNTLMQTGTSSFMYTLNIYL